MTPRLLDSVLVLTVALPWAVTAQSTGPKIVALDGYHNDEKQPHYRWEGTYMGGYSEMGKVLQGLGAELRTIRETLTGNALAGLACLIVSDPDTPAEAPGPKYFSEQEIAAVREWVAAGGRLVLFGNNPGNAEFAHFNKLAGTFGIEFIEKTHLDGNGNSKVTIAVRENSRVFSSPGLFYAVGLAPLKVQPQVESLLMDNGATIMALAKHAKGLVFALGDPWVYNEYIDTKDNRRLATDLFRFLLR